MPVNKMFARTLKGHVAGSLFNMKNVSIIVGIILLAQLLMNYLIIFITNGFNGTSNNSGGILTSGFGIALISMIVCGIAAATGKELKMAFTFPINREIYAIGVFIKFITSSMMLLAITTVAAAIELVGSKITSLLLPRFVMINKIDIAGFLLGFWVSLSYIIVAAAMCYCVFMYFNRFKLIAVALICGTVLLMVAITQGRVLLGRGFIFYFFERSPLLLSIKLWCTALVFHALAYLPLKTLEVKA